MIKKILDWLDDRTGYRGCLDAMLNRKLPAGPKWGYSLGSCLQWLVVVQIVTGALLMGTYSPSTANAWASVHFIESAPAGAFIRGVHYWTNHAIIILIGLHFVRTLLVGAFRKPYEVLWITGLLLPTVVIVLAVTGNPLAGSQKGLAQIGVEAEIAGGVPVVGPLVQRVLLGGSSVGTLTLTHLYFLHVFALPLLVGLILAAHIHQVYRHGLPPGASASSDTTSGGELPYWPHQSFRNVLLLTVVLSLICSLTCVFGAPLHAPPDTSPVHSPRPEWYMLSLYELRGWFPAHLEFLPTAVLPGVGLLLLMLIPVFDRMLSPSISRLFRFLLVLAGAAGLGGLTYQAIDKDRHDPEYLASVELDDWLGTRSRVLADRGPIPPIGATALVQNDPLVQGPQIFAKNCASCHSFVSPEGEENRYGYDIAAKEPSAPNLYGFATQPWYQGWLNPETIKSHEYLGGTHLAEDSEMIEWITGTFDDADDKDQVAQEMATVARALSGDARLPLQAEIDQQDAAQIARGRELITDVYSCVDCHGYDGDLGYAPDLTGHGSREWLVAMISNPEDERFYEGRNDRMPAFGQHPHDPKSNLLSPHEMNMLVDWLRGAWYDPVNNPGYQVPPSEAGLPVAAAAPATTEIGDAGPATSDGGDAAVAAIPASGGAALFERHCMKCHSHATLDGEGLVAKKPSAPNLFAFASLDWYQGWLDPERIAGEHYFGNTAFADGDMVSQVRDTMFDGLDESETLEMKQQTAKIARALVAGAKLPGYADADARDAVVIEEGRELIVGDIACIDCHKFGDEGDLGAAPDLTEHGSAQWLAGMIGNPEHERFYGDTNDRMPAFFKTADDPSKNKLTQAELDTLVEWLRTAGHAPPPPAGDAAPADTGGADAASAS